MRTAFCVIALLNSFVAWANCPDFSGYFDGWCKQTGGCSEKERPVHVVLRISQKGCEQLKWGSRVVPIGEQKVEAFENGVVTSFGRFERDFFVLDEYYEFNSGATVDLEVTLSKNRNGLRYQESIKTSCEDAVVDCIVPRFRKP